MQHSRVAGLLLCGTAAFLTACGSDAASTSQPRSSVPPFSAAVTTMTAGQGCNQNTHPSALIIDTVITPAAFGIAVRDDGLTYFTEVYNGGVGITSTQTRTVDGFIPTGSIPTGLAFSPDGATAYVTNQYSQNVGVINVSTAQQVATIPTAAGNPSVVRVSPDGSRLFIGTTSTTVYIVDTQTLQIIGTVQTGFVPNGFAVNPDGRIMYAAASLGGNVTEFDMFTGTVLRTFNVGGKPQDLAVTKSGKTLYVGNEAGFLNEIDLPTGQITANIPLVGGAFGIGVTPDDVQAYVGIPSQGVVQVFNLQSHHLATTINVGGNPRRIAFSEQGHIGAIANLNGWVTFVR
jgi:YVTN family beta-propeller protein